LGGRIGFLFKERESSEEEKQEEEQEQVAYQRLQTSGKNHQSSLPRWGKNGIEIIIHGNVPLSPVEMHLGFPKGRFAGQQVTSQNQTHVTREKSHRLMRNRELTI
jgi:hypothetical protein